jgi:adenosylmethionine-8-amino-7-oxononanoate aminotransferase
VSNLAAPAVSASRLTSGYDTAQLRRDDLAHFVHPFTHFDSFKRDGSLVIAEAHGAYVFDSEGRRYLDGVGGLWCMSIGFGEEEMAQAIAAQVRRLNFYSAFVDTTNPPAVQLATKLAALAPGDLNRVFYTCSGSAANDTAVRLIHYYNARRGKPEKRHLISRVGSYHGSTYLAMSLTGRESDRSPHFHYLSDFIHHVSCPYVYRRPAGLSVEQFCDQLVEELERKILTLGPENVAAFFAEPILGAGGVIVPPPGYHRRTWEVCKKYDVLYVSDEVVTAFGRLGHWFASRDVFGIEPDIIVSGKGISSGYVPLAALIFSDRIYDVVAGPDPDAWFTHGFTYSGHPVACAAGLKNIEIMESRDICGHIRELGPYFEKRLQSLRELPLVGDVRGSHFMMCTEYVANKNTREVLPDGVNVGKRISDHCEKHGLLIRPLGHLNIMSPPLVMSEAQVDELVAGLAAGIRAAADDLVREGHRID